MGAWVLARPAGLDERGEAALEYWTGEQGERGGPSCTLFRADAYKFSTARAAYECAGTHWQLRDSDDWRPIRLRDTTACTPPRGLRAARGGRS